MGERKRKVIDAHDTIEGGALGGPGVSLLLREGRMRLGYDLPAVATTLRIRLVYLQAIEQGRFSDLPGNAYAAGFLRSYAEFLGLDADYIVRRFKEEVGGKAPKQELYFPTPVPEGRVPGGALLLGTLVLAGVVYGGWYYLSATDRSVVDLVPALPDRLVSLLDSLPWSATTQPVAPDADLAAVDPVPPGASGVPPASASGVPPASASGVPPGGPVPGDIVTARPPRAASPPAPTPVVPAAPPPPAPPPAASTPTAPSPGMAPAAPAPMTAAAPYEPPGETASGEDEPESATQDPTPLPTTPPGAPAPVIAPGAPSPQRTAAADRGNSLPPPTRVYGNQNAASRIQLQATQDSWVQVRDGNNELLFTRVLRPGDLYRVPDRPGIRVRTGNAGGLVVITDGMEGPPMGAVGQVLRDVPLDAPAPRAAGTTN